MCAPLLAALVLAGCATRLPPAPDGSVPVPGAWAGQGAVQAPAARPADDLTQWWQQLGDAQLTGLVTQALQAHTSVRSVMAAAVRRSQAPPRTTCTPKARNTSALATAMATANHIAPRRRIHKPTPATM